MKAIFVKCFITLPKHEGGFLHHLEDLGGAIKLSVTIRVIQGFQRRAFSLGEMKALIPEDMKPVYKKLYADQVRFDELLARLDWVVLD